MSEKQDIQYRIDDINYINEREKETRAELMAMFRTIGEEKELLGEEDVTKI